MTRRRVASPCVGVCQTWHGPFGPCCAGCFRRLDDVAGWTKYTDRQRRAALEAAERVRVAWEEWQRENVVY